MSAITEDFLAQALIGMSGVRGPAAAAAESAQLALLLEAVAAGDEAAFAKLHKRTASRLRAAAYRVLGDRALAEEAVQDAFLQIWQHAATYSREMSAPMTWMVKIARNRAVDFLRQRARERAWYVPGADDMEYEEIASEAAGPEEQVASASDLRELEAALSELGASERKAIELAFIEERTNLEVAAAMGVPLGTAKCWIRRGLARVRASQGLARDATTNDRPKRERPRVDVSSPVANRISTRMKESNARIARSRLLRSVQSAQYASAELR